MARRAAVGSLIALLGLAVPGAADPAIEPLGHFPSAELSIESNGQRHPFQVYLATTAARHEQGLMFVKHLARNRGMLFLWPTPQPQAFWMKNTLIPLDLLFIDADGRIIRIAANATPLSTAPIQSMGLVLGVLEIAGGQSARLGIVPGDRVRYPAFGRH